MIAGFEQNALRKKSPNFGRSDFKLIPTVHPGDAPCLWGLHALINESELSALEGVQAFLN